MIEINLETLLAQRHMTLTELAGAVDITIANLSVLKTGKARAVHFSTLAKLCQVLDCQPGDILSYHEA